MKSEALPRRLTNAERKKRLDAERRLPSNTLEAIERSLRIGLWSKYEDDVSEPQRDFFYGY